MKAMSHLTNEKSKVQKKRDDLYTLSHIEFTGARIHVQGGLSVGP